MDVLQRCSHAHWFITRRQSSHILSSHMVRLGNNWQTANRSTSLNRNMVLVTFNGHLFCNQNNFWTNVHVQQTKIDYKKSHVLPIVWSLSVKKIQGKLWINKLITNVMCPPCAIQTGNKLRHSNSVTFDPKKAK